MPDNDVIYMHLHVAALPWYNICIVLQIDRCRYFIIVFNMLCPLKKTSSSYCGLQYHNFHFDFARLKHINNVNVTHK